MTLYKAIAAGLIVLSAAGCGRASMQAEQGRDRSVSSLSGGEWDATSAGVSAAKLREYCKACHAVGKLRFIWTENDQDLWNYIFTNQAPNRKKLWADAIVEVLSWPGGQPPPATPIMDPAEGRDWMPKGGKRATFAADTVDGVPVRQVILKAIHEVRGE